MSDPPVDWRLVIESSRASSAVLDEITYPAKACHHPVDSSHTLVNLDIDQRAGQVMMLRTRCCGECGTILEPTQRLSKQGFPADPAALLTWMGVVLGPQAWHALKAAYRAERAKHWELKTHLNLDPLGKDRGRQMSVCDSIGHRIDLSRIKVDPREVSCNYCKSHPRFGVIWQQYAERGHAWAQHPPEAPPRDLAELVEGWR